MKLFLSTALLFTSLYSEVSFQAGEELYKNTCTSCHGADGKAQTGVKFVVNPRSLDSSILSQEQTYQIIKKGSHQWGSAADMMPSFENIYNEDQLRSIALYIKEKFNPHIDKKVKDLYAESDPIPKEKLSKMLKRGKKIYKRNCSWCHGLTGEGDGAATANPEKSIYPYNLRKTLLTNEQMFLYTKFGGKFWGTHKTDMPSWSKKYDDYTLKSVVFYIDETFRKVQK